MVMTALAVQQSLNTGFTPTFSAANADGHSIVNDKDFLLAIRNAGVETTVTIATPGTIGGLAIAEVTVVVPATTGEKWAGPFRGDIFNQASGAVYVTFSSVASVTVAAVKL